MTCCMISFEQFGSVDNVRYVVELFVLLRWEFGSGVCGCIGVSERVAIKIKSGEAEV